MMAISMDFDNLEKVCDDKCRIFILCNPHNPGGICWSKETLQKLADFCYDHHLLVISDEIHCDMAIFGHKHIPFATVSDKARENSITFQAPTKTFNIAGIISSYAIIPNADIRKKFYGWINANELDEANIFLQSQLLQPLLKVKNGENRCFHTSKITCDLLKNTAKRIFHKFILCAHRHLFLYGLIVVN